MNLGDLKGRIRALVDDVDVEYTDDAFLEPLVSQAYDTVWHKIESTNDAFDDAVIVIPGVLAGRGDLIPDQQNGNLKTLLNPRRLDWKLAGLPDFNYMPVGGAYDGAKSERLPDVIPTNAVSAWEFLAGYIHFTPATVNVDLRIRGEFMPAAITSDADIIRVGNRIAASLAYVTSSVIGSVRGNSEWVTDYTARAQDDLDEVMTSLTKSDQGMMIRLGRQTGRTGPGAGRRRNW